MFPGLRRTSNLSGVRAPLNKKRVIDISWDRCQNRSEQQKNIQKAVETSSNFESHRPMGLGFGCLGTSQWRRPENKSVCCWRCLKLTDRWIDGNSMGQDVDRNIYVYHIYHMIQRRWLVCDVDIKKCYWVLYKLCHCVTMWRCVQLTPTCHVYAQAGSHRFDGGQPGEIWWGCAEIWRTKSKRTTRINCQFGCCYFFVIRIFWSEIIWYHCKCGRVMQWCPTPPNLFKACQSQAVLQR